LCNKPVLQYPDFSKPFVLTTDASGYAVGGVLSQGKIGKDLPIAYTSRILNQSKQNYSIIKKECLTIIIRIILDHIYTEGNLLLLPITNL